MCLKVGTVFSYRDTYILCTCNVYNSMCNTQMVSHFHLQCMDLAVGIISMVVDAMCIVDVTFSSLSLSAASTHET